MLMPEIRTAVRTGDTLAKERREMLKRPPHILVTTPESLYILLTADKSRAILRDVQTVIVDEIHAVADDKRGAHLALSLERLDLLAGEPTRIGLSATQKPIELVAHFLTGAGRPAPAVVNIGHRRKLDLAVEVPPSELGPIASNEMWGEIYDRIAELGAGASLDAGLREYSTPGGAGGAAPERSPRRRAGGRAPWQPGAQAAAHGGDENSRTARFGCWWRLRRWNSASISEMSTWCARSIRRVRSRWPCSASDAPVTGGERFPRDACSQPHATTGRVRCGRAGDSERRPRPHCRFPTSHSTSWRSRSSRCAVARTGTRRPCSIACAVPILIAI